MTLFYYAQFKVMLSLLYYWSLLKFLNVLWYL